MREDKVAIVAKLEELINLTREGTVQLEYKKECLVKNYAGHTIGMYDEAVEIRRVDENGDVFVEGYANVACDSGVALIRDVLRHPYFN